MRTITFFRQARIDGGIRMGIDVDGATLWHHFQPGSEDYDPALVWYVDLECEGPDNDLPEDKDNVRKWLQDQAPVIKSGLGELSEKLRIGFDSAEPVYEQPISGAPPRITMTLFCSAVRREDARKISSILEETAAEWESLLRRLTPAEEVAAQG